MRTALCGAALLLAAAGAAWADGPQRPAAREALVQRAAGALARGDAAAALRDYETAAAQEHGADIELGIVRSLMAAGQYRRALAFAAHTAQAHPDAPDGARLYAQLLEAGGHARLAAQLRPPGTPPSAAAAPLATGVLIDAGRHALLPLHALHGASTIELCDGHGRPLTAQLVQHNEALGLALLRLASPPADAPRLAWAPRDAFAGSPALAIAAAPLPWPRMHSGFVGSNDLGIALDGDAAGGAVFDSAGRAIGIALAVDGGAGRLAGAQALRAWLGDLLGDAADMHAPALAHDAIYENALRATLQWRPAAP